jgi:glucose/arabinose dehydrogenase
MKVFSGRAPLKQLRNRSGRSLVWLAAASSLAACSSSTPGATTPPPPVDASSDSPTWCGRGSDVPGATARDGFCIKSYAQIPEARFMVLAPNGDLFVASPSTPTAGGAGGGVGAIMLLSDDNHDGVAEEHLFLTGIRDVHALALGPGYLYYTTQNTVFRIPYVVGQRVAAGPSEDLNLPATYRTGGRWTHGLALSPGGHLITSRGEYGMCGSAPLSGEISTINADGSLSPLATGFRNPMYMRCHRTDEVCAAMELGEDLLTDAHEKMLIIHPNTNYGFPCCTTAATPIAGQSAALCGDVTKEDAMFPLSFTPFGFDWEPGNWPAPYQNAVFVAQHGSAYSVPAWQGAGIVFATTDPTTHAPSQAWQPFQLGWGLGGSVLDRPTDIVFAPDGRMFIADDTSGRIFWMAPMTMPAPAAATDAGAEVSDGAPDVADAAASDGAAD